MNPSPVPHRIDLLVLARLYAARKKPAGMREVRSALRQFLDRALPPSEIATMLDQGLSRLEEAGQLTRSPLRITDAGRRRLHDELGLEGPPSWHHVKAALVPALALGLDPKDRRVRRLGRVEELRKLATAMAARARDSDAEAVRTAFAQRWLLGDLHAPATSGRVDEARQGTLEAFGRAVRRHAARAPDGWHGDRKVFIASAWAQARHDPAVAHLDYGGFQDKLIEAHRAGLVTLHRADLVAAMDSEKVSASETRYLNATFHFVEPEASTEP